MGVARPSERSTPRWTRSVSDNIARRQAGVKIRNQSGFWLNNGCLTGKLRKKTSTSGNGHMPIMNAKRPANSISRRALRL